MESRQKEAMTSANLKLSVASCMNPVIKGPKAEPIQSNVKTRAIPIATSLGLISGSLYLAVTNAGKKQKASPFSIPSMISIGSCPVKSRPM